MAPSKIQLGELWLGNPALQVTRASGLPRPAASPFCSLLWESYKLGNPLIKRCCLVGFFLALGKSPDALQAGSNVPFPAHPQRQVLGWRGGCLCLGRAGSGGEDGQMDGWTDRWMDGCQMGDGIEQKWLRDGVSCTRAASLPRDSSPAP